MTYKINKTNGDLLVSIPDGTLDTSTTSLTIVGKNVTSFGESLNENFIKLLENFSNATEPNNPIKGQLWYDTSTGRLNIFDGTAFRTAAGPIISSTPPTNLVAGDIWIDSKNDQIRFYDGTDWILAGPIYTTPQGLTGFKVETLVDATGQDRTICILYVGNILLGIFSKTEFVTSGPIIGYGEAGARIKVGFNAGTLANIKFHVTATTAERILDEEGNPKSAAEIAFLNVENTFTSTATFQSDVSLNGRVALKLLDNNLQIEHQLADKDISLRVKSGAVTQDAITIKSASNRVGIFNTSPLATLDVNGDVIIDGNLTVNGETTTVVTNDLEVTDKTIILGKVDTPSDALAANGGIVLKATIDKTILWDDQTTAWKFSEHIDIPAGKGYKIAGQNILTETALASSVVSSNLTSVGTLTSLAVDNISINDNEVSSTNVDGDISIKPNGNGNINVNNASINNLKNPTNLQDAATKVYVDTTIFNHSLTGIMDITGLTTNAQIAQILNRIYPFYVPNGTPEQLTGVAIDGTILRLHCTKITVTNGTVAAPSLSYTRVNVDKGGVQNIQSVVADVIANDTQGPTATVVVIRQDKVFIMGGGPGGPGSGVSGEWGFYQDVGQAYTTPFTGLGYVLP